MIAVDSSSFKIRVVMKVEKTKFPGLFVLKPQAFGDVRGYFMELYHSEKYANAGIRATFVQDNISVSRQGCLRGLHYQFPNSQGKLIWAVQGSVFDVVVDIRRGSPTFGQWFGTEISSDNRKQLWVPPGFAHGFCVMSETVAFMYKCTDFYSPQSEYTILWNEPSLNIKWPLLSPVLSEKDKNGHLLRDIDPEKLPEYSDLKN